MDIERHDACLLKTLTTCAYCRLQVGAFELPECFEAEERSAPDTDDVLQLVSGRTLLGIVREQQLQYLEGAPI